MRKTEVSKTRKKQLSAAGNDWFALPASLNIDRKQKYLYNRPMNNIR